MVSYTPCDMLDLAGAIEVEVLFVFWLVVAHLNISHVQIILVALAPD